MFQQYDVHLRNSCESCGAPNTSTNQWYAYTPTTLVQLIMTGQTGNQAALMQAHAQALAQLAQSGTAQSTAIYQQRLCADCWSYWKKFSAFKFANAKQERLNQLKNQVHKCAVVGCGRVITQFCYYYYLFKTFSSKILNLPKSLFLLNPNKIGNVKSDC